MTMLLLNEVSFQLWGCFPDKEFVQLLSQQQNVWSGNRCQFWNSFRVRLSAAVCPPCVALVMLQVCPGCIWRAENSPWGISIVRALELQPGTELALAGVQLSFANSRGWRSCQVAWARAAASASLHRGWAVLMQDRRWRSRSQLPCSLPLLPVQGNCSAGRCDSLCFKRLFCTEFWIYTGKLLQSQSSLGRFQWD